MKQPRMMAEHRELEEQFDVFEAALQLIADNCEVIPGEDGDPVIIYGQVDARAVAAEALARVRDGYTETSSPASKQEDA